MEYFDFNAPVSAVIIYDDESDEDVNPIKQEFAQKDETVSVSKSQEGTSKHYVGLDTLRADTSQKNEVGSTKNELKSNNAICTQTNIENESVPTNSLPKLLDMPYIIDVNMKSENVNVKDDSGDKIVNEITTEKNKNEAYVKLVDIEKGKKRKNMDNTEIPDPSVHQPEFSKSKNIRLQNVSDHYKGFGKILDSEKNIRNNDESQEFTNIEIFQKTLPDYTSTYPTTSDASHIKITAGINMNTNCIPTFNCENEAYKVILLSENHTYDQQPRKENENLQKQNSNELATNFNDISDISSNVNVGINRTKSVSNTKYTNKEINPFPTEKNTNQTQNTCCPKQHETYCVRNLLDTVSKHLMYIMDSYQCMIKLYTNNADLKVKEMALNNFVKIKNYFFDLSYSSVLNLILPRKDDPRFTKKFICNTMAIASSKSLNFSYEHIEMLYLDLIERVQNRQKQIKNTISKNVTLINHLQSADGQERRKQRPSSCSMQTNHADKIAHQVSCTQPGHFQPQTRNSVAYRKPPPPYPNQTTQARSMHHGHDVPTQPTRSTYCYQPSTLQFYAGGVGAQPVYNDNTYMMQHMQTTLNSSSLLNGGSITQQSVSLNSTASRPVQYDAAINKQNQSSSLNSVHYTTLNIQDNRSNYLETNPSYVSPPVQPDNSMQTDCSRSSISRDSGFMSPLNFQHNKTLVPEDNRSITPTPLITHVTSLNPKATLSADGLCKVCGKITKHKCIGCYNVYYCCHMCQHFDWSSHQVSCRQYGQTLAF